MKRILATLLALAMIFALSACGSKETNAPQGSLQTNETKATNTPEPEAVSAPEPETVSAPEPEAESTPDNEAENNSGSGWGIGTFVDEFKQPTGYYITEEGIFNGTFSNSVVTKKELKGYFIVDEKKISVKLYEYGSQEVKNPYSKDVLYNITVLDQSKEKHYFYGGMRSKGNRIIFLNDEYEYEKDELIDIFNEEGELSFYIEESDGMSEYYFTVDFTGFADAYKKLKEQ